MNNPDVVILLANDAAGEGVNLQRAHLMVNYDLPWNPTRDIQRTGRVNRVGTEFDKVYIYNFFPTEQSDDEAKKKAPWRSSRRRRTSRA